MPGALRMAINFGDSVNAHAVIYAPSVDGAPFLVMMIDHRGVASLLGQAPTLDEANTLMQACIETVGNMRK